MARCLNLSLSVFYNFGNYFQPLVQPQAEGRQELRQAAMTDICGYEYEGIKAATLSQLRTSLAAATGKLVLMSSVHRRLHKSSLYVNDQKFVSKSPHVTAGNV